MASRLISWPTFACRDQIGRGFLIKSSVVVDRYRIAVSKFSSMGNDHSTAAPAYNDNTPRTLPPASPPLTPSETFYEPHTPSSVGQAARYLTHHVEECLVLLTAFEVITSEPCKRGPAFWSRINIYWHDIRCFLHKVKNCGPYEPPFERMTLDDAYSPRFVLHEAADLLKILLTMPRDLGPAAVSVDGDENAEDLEGVDTEREDLDVFTNINAYRDTVAALIESYQAEVEAKNMEVSARMAEAMTEPFHWSSPCSTLGTQSRRARSADRKHCSEIYQSSTTKSDTPILHRIIPDFPAS